MTPRAALFLPLLVTAALATACDSASVYEDCDRPEKEGTGEPRCFPSTFAKEDPRARESAGFVHVGDERAPNTLVSVDGHPTTTDSAGIYRFRDTPFVYDVGVRFENDVIGVHAAAHRVLNIALEREVPAKGYSGKVELAIDGAPRAGHRLAVFVSGENVVGLAGTLADGLVVSSRVYENDKVKLHVVEYPENESVEKAVANGNVDVRVRADATTTASVTLNPIAERKTSTFKVVTDAAEPFLEIEDLELMVDTGLPVSRISIRKVRVDEKLELPVIDLGGEGDDRREAGWLVRGKATRADGSFASIGLRPFRAGDELTLAYYAPPTAERNEGSVLWAKRAQPTGAFEHELVPLSGGGGGKTIHVFSAKPNTPVPDLAPLGLPPARGEYRWTVRAFPDHSFVENLTPRGERLYRSSSTSSPRTITLP